MKNLGLLLIAIGVISTIIGTYIMDWSLSDYIPCVIGEAIRCGSYPLPGQAYAQFLWGQNIGGSVFFYGLALTIIGAIFYSSVQMKRVGAPTKEPNSDAPKV